MKKHLLGLSFLLMVTYASAQNWLGLSTGNYAGTNGVYLNPSSIVDSRLGGYINFFGNGTNFYNNYVRFSSDKSLFKSLRSDSVNITDDNIIENLNGKDKIINFSNETRGPSFMVSLHPKHAFAITTRNRLYVQAVDISQPIARMIRWGLKDSTQGFAGPDGLSFNELYSQTRFGINVNDFTEIGFTYAAVIVDKKQHFLKAGITYKYIAGLYSMYFKNDGGSGVEIGGDDSLVFNNTNISYGYVNEGLYRQGNGKYNFDASQIFGPNRVGKGYGIDLGVTYELRPKYKNYRYTLDGKERWDKEENKYLARISATLMDIGRIKYSSNKYVQNNTLAKNKIVQWGQIDTLAQGFQKFDSLGPGESVFSRFDRAVGQVFGFDNQSNELISKLPTAFNIQADFKVLNNFYVNVLWLQGLRKKGAIGMRQFSMLSATPRIETRWFEAALPIVINNDYRNLAIGAMVRFGPFYVGSDNISGLLKSKNVYGFDVYAGLYLPLYKRNPRDKDNDGVSDRKDKCKNVPGKFDFNGCPDTDGDGIEDAKDSCKTIAGVAKFNGCPDTDGDGVPDNKDECPEVAGLAVFNGCPDTDGDGIENRLDSCVDVKGLKEFNGCPDSDGDGIEDSKDDCPNKPGLAQFNGCPDTDNDGIRDIDDKCPEKAGLPQFKGCPDTDGDGIPDNIDKCPDAAGKQEFGGCPDTDGDGVPDHKDLCPLEAGLAENNGCPKVDEQIEIVELEEEEEKVLREAFDNLEFETGKSIISKESYTSLDELATLLTTKTAYRIYIAGHTDNVGQKKANQKLSEDRAKAVKEYLVSKGIDGARIKTEGFGDARPIADNNTAEGKQKNRRVEFKIIK
jgi:outer membrane protein OmpA-like peptidoglycan-associated protein